MEIQGTFRLGGTEKLDTDVYTGAFSATANGGSYGTGHNAGNNPLVAFKASNAWSGETSSVGESSAHNNIEPYLAVFLFKRTS